MNISKINILLVCCLLVGVMFRFVNLNWGSPIYFHPDERNIATLVALPFQSLDILTKGAFAYGNFLIVLGIVLRTLASPILGYLGIVSTFSQAIIVLRFFSFLSSIILLFFIYKAGAYWSKGVALISTLLATFSVGFIQSAHFGTFDMFVTTCLFGSFYFLLTYLTTKKIVWVYISLLAIALAGSAKITSLMLLIFPLIVVLLQENRLVKKMQHILFGVIAALATTIILSPYYTTATFFSNLLNEQGIVSGRISIFYTQSFTHTLPLLFQIFHIYPFLLNPFVELFCMLSLGYIIFLGIKQKNVSFLLLISYFLFLFIFQGVQFAKWTRYMLPTLPFLYVLLAIFLQYIKNISRNNITTALISFLPFLCVGISFFYSYAYIQSAFLQEDSRVQAAQWAKVHIPFTSSILTEPYDIGSFVFQLQFPYILDFPFYDEEDNVSLPVTLASKLGKTDVIILPSQRLYRSRLLDKNAFPKGYAFYHTLTSGSLGFKKVYQTPCSLFCKINSFGNYIFAFEETALVFDNPTVFIFQKEKSFSQQEYIAILK